jgi:hypothetical protein
MQIDGNESASGNSNQEDADSHGRWGIDHSIERENRQIRNEDAEQRAARRLDRLNHPDALSKLMQLKLQRFWQYQIRFRLYDAHFVELLERK